MTIREIAEWIELYGLDNEPIFDSNGTTISIRKNIDDNVYKQYRFDTLHKIVHIFTYEVTPKGNVANKLLFYDRGY